MRCSRRAYHSGECSPLSGHWGILLALRLDLLHSEASDSENSVETTHEQLGRMNSVYMRIVILKGKSTSLHPKRKERKKIDGSNDSSHG